MRIVIELKKDAIPTIVINSLYRETELQSAFYVNNVALVKGRPRTLNLRKNAAIFIQTGMTGSSAPHPV